MIAVVAGVVVALGLGGVFLHGIYRGFTRTVEAARSDEDAVRAELAIPSDARLLSLTAEPTTPGTFGREGLRIVARFELPPASLAAFAAARRGAPGWGALPVPEAIFGFPSAPDELPRDVPRGLHFCEVGTWRVGTTFDPHPCGAPPPRFDRYRAAVLDEERGHLTVVMKNYY